MILEEETKRILEPAVPVKPPSRQYKKYGVKGERRVPCAEPEPETESESESEEEVIVVKKSKPVKKQKKVRKIIIEESSSEDEPEPPPRPQRKPIVRVIRPNPNDFFC